MDTDTCFKVGKSKTMVDLTTFTFEEYWDDPGKGLFQTRDGGIPLKFVGPDIISVPRTSLNERSQQWKYAVDGKHNIISLVPQQERGMMVTN